MPIDLPAAKILVIDDDSSICDFVRTLLERDGFQAKTICDPLKAEDEVRHERYHLIILDLMMPSIDGIALLGRIRKIDWDVPVVIVTGYPHVETAVASMRLGVVDYIKKPFDVEEFREVVGSVMRKKGLSRTSEERLCQAIGECIHGFRKSKALTLQQMSRRTNLSASLLSQIERGASWPSLLSLSKIASALDVDIRDLFGDY